MASQKTRIVIVVAIVIALVVVGGYFIFSFVKDKANMPVPNAMDQVQSYIHQQSDYIVDSEPFVAFQTEPQELVSAEIFMENQAVDLLVARFNNNNEAENAMEKYTNQKDASVKTHFTEVHLVSSAYWTAEVWGEKVYSWRNNEWLIIIQGSASAPVKDLYQDFKAYLENK